MTVCKNCAFEFEGKYCPQCGQKAKTKRITTKAVLEEVRRSFVHYDQGFFFTVIQLLRRPGHALREYIEGKRVMHIKPVKFMLWAIALNFLVFHLVGLDDDMVGMISEQQGKNVGGMKFTKYIFDHPTIVLFLMVPNIAFFSWLYFRRHGYNYAEHFVLNAYLMGMVSLFGVVMNPILKLLSTGKAFFYPMVGVQILIWFAYTGWVYTQFFQPRKKWLAWLKGALVVFSGYIMLLVLVSILTALVIILFWPWVKPFFIE